MKIKVCLKKAMLIFVIPFVIITVSSYFNYKIEVDNIMEDIKIEQIRESKHISLLLGGDIGSLKQDVFLLSKSLVVENYLEDDSELNLKKLNNRFLEISKIKGIYGQIRYIDSRGMEIARVDRNLESSYIVEKSKLQNKSNRYYFKESFDLSKDEIFISRLDLNVERGVVEYPIKPMIRLGIPLFDKKMKKKGVLVFNYLAENILSRIDNVIEEGYNVGKYETHLLNSDGYWLSNPDVTKSWGFMYEDKKDVKFSMEYKEEWSEIVNSDNGQIETEKGVFAYETVYPLELVKKKSYGYNGEKKDEYKWKTVVFIRSGYIKKLKNHYKQRNFLFAGIIIFVVSVMSVYIANILEKKQRIKNELVKSNGDVFDKNLELVASLNEVEVMVRRLEEVNKTKDKFFAVISHDLRSPFNGILGMLSLLDEDYDGFETLDVKENIHILNVSAKHYYELLENLLNWALIQKDGIVYKKEKRELKKAFDNVLPTIKKIAKSKEIELNIKLEYKTVAYFDKNTIETVIRNLITNAIKFTKRGGKIELGFEEKEEFVKLFVKDNGIGMNKDKIENLFKLSANDSEYGTDGEKGTGLGLLLCKEFVEGNGGKLFVKSIEGEGSLFYFELPKNKV